MRHVQRLDVDIVSCSSGLHVPCLECACSKVVVAMRCEEKSKSLRAVMCGIKDSDSKAPCRRNHITYVGN